MWREFKRKYIGDRDFYKRYLWLALPMILQNAITNLVSFLDNIMVGQLGTEQMSGVAIVNQLIFEPITYYHTSAGSTLQISQRDCCIKRNTELKFEFST